MNRRDFLLSSGGAVLAASMTSVRAATPVGSCAANVNGSGVQMIDLSHSLTLNDIERLSILGVRTIGRYYVHATASRCLPSKLLDDDEFKAFKAFNSRAGSPKMAVVTAYQECNGCSKFIKDRSELIEKAQADGMEAARLAGNYKQPQQSAIYFGVDFNAHPFAGDVNADMSGEEKCRKENYKTQRDIDDRIKTYFSEAGKQLRKNGNRWPVGVYAGGNVCKVLSEAGLAEYFWLRASVGDYGTPNFYSQKAWHIFQCRNEIKDYRGIAIEGNVDADITNPLKPYYGQWFPGVVALPQGMSEADAERIMMGRAFYPTASKGFFQRNETTGELINPIGKTPVLAQGRTCRLVKCFPARSGIAAYAGVSFEEGDKIHAYFYVRDLVIGLPYGGMPKIGDQP